MGRQSQSERPYPKNKNTENDIKKIKILLLLSPFYIINYCCYDLIYLRILFIYSYIFILRSDKPRPPSLFQLFSVIFLLCFRSPQLHARKSSSTIHTYYKECQSSSTLYTYIERVYKSSSTIHTYCKECKVSLPAMMFSLLFSKVLLKWCGVWF